MTFLILFIVGLAVGVTTVLFGFGGGFVTVPIILLVDASRGDDAVRIAVATSALVMVVNAVIATISTRQKILNRLRGRRALFILLAIGGVAGAGAALFVPDAVARWGFVAYIGVTIVDLLLRPGFLSRRATDERSDGIVARALPDAFGIPVGAIASFLGVGGSVMTVPMMRRSGMEMSTATSLANPLTIAIAVPAMVVACAFGGGVASGAGLVGTVDVASALALLVGAVPVIVVLRRQPPRIPEAVHSWAYLVLLVVAAAAVGLTG
ncbi:sulfite exporter TauE/SafE family protein [Microbacterium sp. MPKO10]|uniref:sulfite exporter TauE/SafE family protein n=1 Tax=Microbacterium sp. MPKO10 TaxID=2989818 RepID=UPI0022364EAD|nr:sulfite exporter TauE/SafE family protein [Microbacterium sp. MPKO10]MCW4458002.1 sulfite exporter TauE/SafE family protein [Microbacterium sp. MPKO10]